MKRFFNWAKRSSSPNDSNGSSNRSLSHENSSMESTPYDNYPSASSSPSSSPMEESREAETAASSSSPSSSSAVASSPLHLRALLCPTTTTTGGAAALPSSPLLSREKNGTMEHHHSNFNSGSPPATSLAEEAEEEEEEEGEEEEGFFNHKDKKRLKRGVAPPSTNSAFHHFHHLLLQEEAEEGEASSYGFTSMMETTSVAGGLGGVASFDGSFFPFTQLPTELQLKTIQHVFTLRDVCAVRGTCWHFHALAQHNTVWRTLARRRFCIPKSRVRWYKHLDWQAYFRQYLLFQQPGILRWEKVRITGEATRPCARYAHTGAAIGTDIYYIGGQNLSGARLAEIYRYDTVQREFHQVTLRNGKVPNFARHQSVCIDGLIYSFGGFDLEVFYNVAVFDPKQRSWSYPVCKGQIPPPRSNHSSAVIGNCFYIFGGSVGDNVNKYEIIGDFYCLNTETMVWKKIEAKGAPSRRVGHKMVSVGDEIFLFGGGLWSAQEGWTTQYNDIYFYTAAKNEWTEVKPRVLPPMSTYSYLWKLGTFVFVFGGAAAEGNHVINGLWAFDTVSLQWHDMSCVVASPSPSSSSSASDSASSSSNDNNNNETTENGTNEEEEDGDEEEEEEGEEDGNGEAAEAMAEEETSRRRTRRGARGRRTFASEPPSNRSMGTVNVVQNERAYVFGGYCGGVIPCAVDFYCLQVTRPELVRLFASLFPFNY